MDIINIVVAVSSILVPAAAYIVTTMVITKRNSIDIRELAVEIKSIDNKFSGAIKALDDKFTVSIKSLDDKFTAQLSTVKADVAVIKAICQERSRSDKAEQNNRRP
ncbi:hypothetical protein FACS1894102_7690 [Spirochaetia bacterium]|nr:hypothetical protein FACS1894102_7690 [Spirochaetia bacterium]